MRPMALTQHLAPRRSQSVSPLQRRSKIQKGRDRNKAAQTGGWRPEDSKHVSDSSGSWKCREA